MARGLAEQWPACDQRHDPRRAERRQGCASPLPHGCRWWGRGDPVFGHGARLSAVGGAAALFDVAPGIIAPRPLRNREVSSSPRQVDRVAVGRAGAPWPRMMPDCAQSWNGDYGRSGTSSTPSPTGSGLCASCVPTTMKWRSSTGACPWSLAWRWSSGCANRGRRFPSSCSRRVTPPATG